MRQANFIEDCLRRDEKVISDALRGGLLCSLWQRASGTGALLRGTKPREYGYMCLPHDEEGHVPPERVDTAEGL